MKRIAIPCQLTVCSGALAAMALSLASAEDDSRVVPHATVKSIEAIEARFREDQSRLEEHYRKSLANEISQATIAEIFVVEFDLEVASQEPGRVRIRRNSGYDGSNSGWGNSRKSSTAYFWIAPYAVESRVLVKKTLKADSSELKSLRQCVAKAVSGIDGERPGGLGHMPTHGIRLYCEDGAKVVFETSVSPLFKNLWVRYPGYADYWKWHELPCGDLPSLLEAALPAPPEYAARYRESVERLTGKVQDR